jgi:hypothetical protein
MGEKKPERSAASTRSQRSQLDWGKEEFIDFGNLLLYGYCILVVN